MRTFVLAAPLHFFAVPNQDTFAIPRQPDMQWLCRGDVVQVGAYALLVVGSTGTSITFSRSQQYRQRSFGGLAYLRWWQNARWDDGETDDTAPPMRARPMVRTTPVWRNIVIAAGTTGLLTCRTFIEGSGPG